MSVLEEKKIVIRLPKLHWPLLLSLFALSLAIGYWYKEVRPYFWIRTAHLEALSAILSSDASGRIVEMGPQEGQSVKRGQTLFVLDRDLLLAKQAQAKRFLDFLHQQIEKEKEKIGKAMENYLAATSELEMGLCSSEKVEKQLTLMEEAQAQAEQASSQLTAARAELADLDLQVEKRALLAPFDGVVLTRSKQPGAVVSFGDPIYVLCDPEKLWIEAKVPERRLRSIALGTPAKVFFPAYPRQEWKGKISWIGPATVAKSVPIRIALDAPAPSLKPGLSAHIALKIH